MLEVYCCFWIVSLIVNLKSDGNLSAYILNDDYCFSTRMRVSFMGGRKQGRQSEYRKIRSAIRKYGMLLELVILKIDWMEMSESGNAFSYFDFSLEEAQEVNQMLKKNGRLGRDARVCVCGHPMSRHNVNLRGVMECKPSAMNCPCKVDRAVVKAQDVRDFLRKTIGGGSLHALGRGLQTAIEKGHEVEWIVEMKCDRCNEEGPISPTPVTQNGVGAEYATGYDALLCKKCRTEV